MAPRASSRPRWREWLASAETALLLAALLVGMLSLSWVVYRLLAVICCGA
jgi:hypothetical protein